MPVESWNRCGGCGALFKPGFSSVCPAGTGLHDAAGAPVAVTRDETPAGYQGGWGRCSTCALLFKLGVASVCAGAAAHTQAPGAYSVKPVANASWRRCATCAVLFFASGQSICPASRAAHVSAAGAFVP